MSVTCLEAARVPGDILVPPLQPHPDVHGDQLIELVHLQDLAQTEPEVDGDGLAHVQDGDGVFVVLRVQVGFASQSHCAGAVAAIVQGEGESQEGGKM
jgi:hypothetical protein